MSAGGNHALLVGMTGCGKSTLAKSLARRAARRGRGVIVLSPFADAWPVPPALLVLTHNVAAFLEAVNRSENCLIIADEAGTGLDRHEAAHLELVTASRHRGHDCLLLCQYYKQLPPVMRDNCSLLCLFASSVTTARLCADDWADANLGDAGKLPKYRYLRKLRAGPPSQLHTTKEEPETWDGPSSD